MGCAHSSADGSHKYLEHRNGTCEPQGTVLPAAELAPPRPASPHVPQRSTDSDGDSDTERAVVSTRDELPRGAEAADTVASVAPKGAAEIAGNAKRFSTDASVSASTAQTAQPAAAEGNLSLSASGDAVGRPRAKSVKFAEPLAREVQEASTDAAVLADGEIASDASCGSFCEPAMHERPLQLALPAACGSDVGTPVLQQDPCDSSDDGHGVPRTTAVTAMESSERRRSRRLPYGTMSLPLPVGHPIDARAIAARVARAIAAAQDTQL